MDDVAAAEDRHVALKMKHQYPDKTDFHIAQNIRSPYCLGVCSPLMESQPLEVKERWEIEEAEYS
jgi:hypothetical protein